MSCILFHGPSARQSALAYAHQHGRLVTPPLGDEGLKIADVRDAMDLLHSTPVGMATGMVVIGPMDRATPKASDGLLKSIEEHTDVVLPVLWAFDLGEVSSTIRSRCLDRWCPKAESLEDDEIDGDGRRVAQAALTGDIWVIPSLLKKYDRRLKDGTLVRRLPDLLGVVAESLASDYTCEAMALWERLRPVAELSNPTRIEIFAACLGESDE